MSADPNRDNAAKVAFLSAFTDLAREHGYDIGQDTAGDKIIAVQIGRTVGGYAVSIAIAFEFIGGRLRIAIDCEKPPANVQNYLESSGWRVITFPASKLRNLPWGCALEILHEIEEFQTAQTLRSVQ